MLTTASMNKAEEIVRKFEPEARPGKDPKKACELAMESFENRRLRSDADFLAWRVWMWRIFGKHFDDAWAERWFAEARSAENNDDLRDTLREYEIWAGQGCGVMPGFRGRLKARLVDMISRRGGDVVVTGIRWRVVGDDLVAGCR